MLAVKREITDAMTVKARLTLFHGTRVSATTALSIPEDQITYDLFLQEGIKAVNFLAAGMGPCDLKARGVDTAHKLVILGFDSLHLTNVVFCHQALLSYGRDDVISTFLQTPRDAVNLSGSEAVSMLKITTSDLLTATIGSPSHASSVLMQLPRGKSLKEVKAQLLLDSGLRLKTLSEAGYTLEALLTETDVTPAQLSKLGFEL